MSIHVYRYIHACIYTLAEAGRLSEEVSFHTSLASYPSSDIIFWSLLELGCWAAQAVGLTRFSLFYCDTNPAKKGDREKGTKVKLRETVL